MRHLILFMTCFLFTTISYSQDNVLMIEQAKKAFTVGYMQGGGALVGSDFECLVSRHIALQVGFGFTAFGGGINYHFQPNIRSSFLSLQYWNQSKGDSFGKQSISFNYVTRSNNFFTWQIGLGTCLSPDFSPYEGYYTPFDIQSSYIFLTYAVGVYIPW